MNINKSQLSLVTLILTILLPLPLNITATLLLSSQVLAQSSQNQEAQADKLFKDGSAKIDAGQYQDAINLLQPTLKIYQNINQPAGIVMSLRGLGLANQMLAKYAPAIEYYHQALQIIPKINDKKGALELETVVLFGLGNSYASLGDYSEAIKYSKKSIDTAKKSSNLILEANALKSLGDIYSISGNTDLFKESKSLLEESLEIARKIGVSVKPLQARILISLGTVYAQIGDVTKSKEYFTKSLAMSREIGDKKLEAQILSVFAEIESLEKITGSSVKTLEELQKLMDFLSGGLGNTNNLRDDKNKQELLNRASDALNRCGINIKEVTELLNNISNLNDYEKLPSELKNCLLNNVNTNENNAKNLPSDTPFSVEMGLLIDSVNGLMSHQSLPENSFNNQSKVNTLNNLAESFHNLGNVIATTRSNILIKDHQELLAARKSQDRQNEGFRLHEIGNNHLMLQNFPQAELSLFDAVKVWESIRTDLGNNDSYKVSYFDTKIQTYQLLQIALIKQNKIEKALEVAERGRARAFIDLLAAQNLPTNQIERNIPDISLLKRIAQQQQATIVEYSLINHPRVPANNLYIWVIKPTGEVNFKEIDLKEWEEKNSFNLVNLVTDTRLSVIRDNRSGEQLSSRFKIGDRVKLKDDWPDEPSSVIIGKNPQTGKWILEIPGKKDTYEKPESELVRVTTVHDIKTGLHQLHQLLIEPIADFLPKNTNDRVIFVPQQLLFSVPFPALQDKDGRYLIEKHTILTAPAIQVLDSTYQRRKQVPGNAKEALVIGNPTMLKVPLKPGAAPQQLPSLPNSQIEAEEIARDFGTTALTGNKSDKNTVIARMPKANIIHLATHGKLDDEQGINSGIVLTNSFLTAKEIINLKLNAELVVLSACDTGQGKLTGDGVIGLSRAFIAAGTPSVIVSLWAVGDESTSYLMQQFYQNRQNSKDNAQALRQAMLTTMKKYPEPSQWAAFTLIGEAK